MAHDVAMQVGSAGQVHANHFIFNEKADAQPEPGIIKRHSQQYFDQHDEQPLPERPLIVPRTTNRACGGDRACQGSEARFTVSMIQEYLHIHFSP
jgi:hypothetical protein